MVETKSLRALEIIADAASIIAEGEVMQLAAAKDTGTTEDAYLRVISAKTAALFAAASEIGAVISERNVGAQVSVRRETDLRHRLPAR